MRIYKGKGVVSKIQRQNRKGKPCLAVQVDINIESPVDGNTQGIPKSDISYKNVLSYTKCFLDHYYRGKRNYINKFSSDDPS